MPDIDRAVQRNLLLRRLPSLSLAALLPHLEPIPLPKTTSLSDADAPFTHAYFPESGIGSIISTSPEGLECESGLFGWDGFSPTGLVMGADSAPYRVFMQVSGHGLRILAPVLRRATETDTAVRETLLRYAQVLSVQASYTSLSNAVHTVDERLARWLLMCHDRVEGCELALTHEFLSLMLAVRRPSVTTSLHVLEENRLITTERGIIMIRDRKGLEEFAGDAYGRPEAEYTRLLGPRPA